MSEKLGSGTAFLGRQLGPYTIHALLGVGGMGEVYRAHDEKLGRDVAIKILARAFTDDPERLARFEREARILASLNHPNIGGIYGLEDVDGEPALVLELVEGVTLAERLDQRAGAGLPALPMTETLTIARQIADALEAAHDRGIVHRDLKPANIKITSQGTVKVLDFGLAKAVAVGSSNLLGGPNVTMTGTREGTILGTVAYMSPEQASGTIADQRSDLWSFGAVLLEMLTGRAVFTGETASHVLANVLNSEPDWTTLPAATPAPIRRLLRRCLEKDRKRRINSAADARLEIEDALTPPKGDAIAQGGPATARRWPAWQKWSMIAAALAVIVAGVAALATITRPPAVHPRHFTIPVPGEVSQLALSSDGELLAFVTPDESSGKSMLHVQAIGARHATVLAGTEGASYPFWSPDNAYVGFFADGKIMKVKSSGGASQTIVVVTPTARGASWGSKNVLVYSQRAGGPLWRVNADGTGAAAVTDTVLTPDEQSHRWPVFLPDGDRFLFWGGHFSKDGEKSGIYLSSLSTRQKVFIVAAWSNPGFAQNGNVFYVDEKGRLVMQSFDPDAGHVSADVRVIADAVGFQPALYWGSFTVSVNGTLVANSSVLTSQSVLTWYDRGGKELGTVGQPAMMYNPSLSPDGQRLAVDISDAKASNVDVWVFDLMDGTAGRFTFGSVEEATPVWSPDGRQIAYQSPMTGTEMKLTSGLEKGRVIAQRPSQTLTTGNNNYPNTWSRDGRYLVTMVEGVGQERSHLVLFKVGDPTPANLPLTNGNETNGQVSPDGNWLAYASDESGTWTIYVTTFPRAAGKWQVSGAGGTEPRWRGDGKEIFYLDLKSTLTAVTVRTDPTFSSGIPQPLFRARVRPPLSNTDLFSYDVAKDGSRFIVNRYVRPSAVPPLDILLNATAAE